jgi:tRNA pseudouridine55 synthase
VSLPPRTVEVFAIDLAGLTPDSLSLRVRCSKGTYIRSLASAIAERLGTVGHVSRLRRLASGPFRIEDAVPMAWIHTASREAILGRLRSPEVSHAGSGRTRGVA